MSETLREYAFESLIACNELEMIRRQHAAYFLRLIETIEPKLHGAEQESCLNLLDADYNNIRSALTWSCVSDIEMALRMSSILWEFWLARGYLSEGRAWLTDILQRSESVSHLPVRIRAQVLNGAGLLASVQGDQSAASVYLQESLRLFRELDDQMGEAWSLNHLGQAMYRSGQQEQAESVFEASLKLFRALGDSLHSAWVLINLGEANLQRGNTDSALALLSEAHDLFITLNHKRGMAAAIDRLARLALFLHESSRATVLFSESLRLFDEIGDREGSGWALHHLGRMAYEGGQNKQALESLIKSLRLFNELNDGWGFALSLLRLAKVISDMVSPERAAMLFGAADAMMAPFYDRMLVSESDFIEETLSKARSQSDGVTWSSGQFLTNEKVLAWISDQSFFKG